MCDNCHNPECEGSEITGTVRGVVFRKGFMQWGAIVQYQDTSYKGQFSRKYFTQWGAKRGCQKMVMKISKIRLDVLTVQLEGK